MMKYSSGKLIYTHISFYRKIIFFTKLFFTANSLTNILSNKQKHFCSQKKELFDQRLKIYSMFFIIQKEHHCATKFLPKIKKF